MKVLLSIKPEFVSSIFEGTKRFEYRKTIFKSPVKRVIIYETAPTKKIVGEFAIDGVLFDDLDILWSKTKHHSGITENYFYSYFSNKDKGYAIKIAKVSKYKTPFPLQNYQGVNPPQSFMYLK